MSLSNRVILILYQLASNSGAKLRSWLYRLARTAYTRPDLLNRTTLHQRINKLQKQLQGLGKSSKQKAKEALLEGRFMLLQLSVSHLPATQTVFNAAAAVQQVVLEASSQKSAAEVVRRSETGSRAATS